MDCNQFKSVVALVDSLVRSAQARRSHQLLSSFPVLAPVPRKSLTDFSICSILGLETDVTQSSSTSDYNGITSPPLSPYSDYCTSPRPSHRETSPPLTPYSDIESSSSDCSSEFDQVSTYSEQLPIKKRQRTTFSPSKVKELERAFERQPYLIDDDAELLAQRIGITVKSVRYWFRNRRTKLRKLESKLSLDRQTNLSNHCEVVTRARTLQFEIQTLSNHWKQAECISYPLVNCNFRAQQCSRPITLVGCQLSNKFNQFRGSQSFALPMFHPDQIKIRSAHPTRIPHSRVSRRFQPY